LRITETYIKGCFLLSPDVHKDERGSFLESYNKKVFEDCIGQQIDFVQDNQSISKKGALRGLHYQKGTKAQSKLVRVVSGEILDVIVDIRKGSETFGAHLKIVLSAEKNEILFIPKGMAHGFVTLSKEAIFLYKCDEYYNKEAEGGIIYSDSQLNIDWEVNSDELIVSDKDKRLPTFKEAVQ
jgi:dTDP-4-dehydrorhamnose 3,5-epimerase